MNIVKTEKSFHKSGPKGLNTFTENEEINKKPFLKDSQRLKQI